MREILYTLREYTGSGWLTAVYFAALLLLLVREKSRVNRWIFVYMPLIFLALFFLPPFHAVYARIEGADTFYRLLWMVPMTATICYAGAMLARRIGKSGLVVICALLIAAGSYVYAADNVNVQPAQNRLHLPQMVMNICDIIMNDTQGEVTMAAMPAGLTQFVRQYDSRIQMPYGREMQMPQYEGYYHAVYAAMEQTDVLDPAQLVAALEEYACNYVVLEAAKPLASDPADSGMVLIGNTDGYDIYVCPHIVSAWKR